MAIQFLNTVAVDTSVLYVDTSSNRVGIRTTNPSFPLEVDGGTGDGIKIKAGNTSNDDSFLIANSSNTTLFLVDGGGKVGIGTNGPTQKLDVNGNVTANRYYSSISTTFYLDPSDSTTAARLAGGLEIGYGSAGEYRIEVGEGRTGNGYAYVDLVGDTTYSDYGLRIIRNNSGANTSSQFIHRGTGTLNFKNWDAANMTFDTSNIERMRITSAGNVGIGTTNPGAKLDVNNEVQIDTYSAGTTIAHNAGYIKLLSDAKTGWAPGDEFGKIEFYNRDTSGIGARNAASIRAVNNTGNGSSTTTFEGELAFYTSLYNTAEAEAVRIDSAGNVGIGTSSPGGKLEINGGTGVATSGGTLIVRQDGDTSSDGIALTSSNAISHRMYKNASGTFLMGPSTDADAFALDSNGAVGIGTTSPSAKLHVSGGTMRVDNTAPLLALNSTSSFPTVIVQAEQQGSASPPMGQLRWDRNPGLVGVQLNYYNGTTENSLRLDGSNFRVINNGSERMRINSSGNVGIGKTSPNAKLDINGGVRIANDTSAASASNVGTLKYYTSGNNSYVDMCMQTGSSTYAWVNIVTNNW